LADSGRQRFRTKENRNLGALYCSFMGFKNNFKTLLSICRSRNLKRHSPKIKIFLGNGKLIKLFYVGILILKLIL
jgi:hypothetical protein